MPFFRSCQEQALQYSGNTEGKQHCVQSFFDINALPECDNLEGDGLQHSVLSFHNIDTNLSSDIFVSEANVSSLSLYDSK